MQQFELTFVYIMKIGIFDSGFGGLTVLKEMRRCMPEYSYVYLGDNARAPYGIRSQEIIFEYTRQAVRFFFEEQQCALVIVACNTASAEALRKIQQEYLPTLHTPLKNVLGVLIPTAEEAVAASKNKRVGVIATTGTVESGAFIREMHKIDPTIHITQKATPLLVPLIEEGWKDKPETTMILKKYLRSLKHSNVDTLILGCTHYPILEKKIIRIMGKKVQMVTSAKAAGRRLLTYLQRHPELEKTLAKKGEVEYFTTDDPKRFMERGRKIEGNVRNVQQVHLV